MEMTSREQMLKEAEYEMEKLKEKFRGEGNKSDMANRQSQIAQESIHLTNEIDKLHEKISILDDRLSTILRYSDPKPEDVDKAESLVPFAEFMRGKAWLVASATERIEDILRRLEL